MNRWNQTAVLVLATDIALIGIIVSTVLAEPTPVPKLDDIESSVSLVEELPVSHDMCEYPKPMVIKQSLGEYRITAYCSCEKCCGVWATNRPKDENGKDIVNGASGNRLIAKYSVAASLPYGTILEIDGLDGYFRVDDRTAQWVQDKYAGKVIDIYIDNHQGCYEYLSEMPSKAEVSVVTFNEDV